MALYGRMEITDTVQRDFYNTVHENFLLDGFQLKAVIGTKFKVKTKSAGDIRFYITGQSLAEKKPDVPGAPTTQTAGTAHRHIDVKPEEYKIADWYKTIEMDETGLNIEGEFSREHARSMGIKADLVTLEALAAHTFANRWLVNGGTKLDLYTEDVLKMNEATNGIGTKVRKFLVMDSRAEKFLMANELFINADYGTGDVVTGGTLHGKNRLGYNILVLEDLDAEAYGTEYMLPAETMYILYENSMCMGMHREGNTTIKQHQTHNNDWLIYTEFDMGVKVLGDRGVFKVLYDSTATKA